MAFHGQNLFTVCLVYCFFLGQSVKFYIYRQIGSDRLKKSILSAAVFFLAICLLSVTALAATHAVSDSASALKYIQKDDISTFIDVEKSFSINSDFSVNKGTTISSVGGSITLSGGASVYNEGRINEHSLLLSTPSSIQNYGYLELNSIPAGSTVENYGKMVSPQGILINGTLALRRGSSFSFSKNSVINASAVINMGLGARFVTESAGRYTIFLPDASKVTLQGPFDYTVRKTAVPTIILSSPDSQGRCKLTITDNSGSSINSSIYFTIDGSTPSIQSSIYTSQVYVNKDATVKAVAKSQNSMLSDVVTVTAGSSASEQIQPSVPEQPSSEPSQKSAEPSISPAAGTYTFRQVITLSAPNAKIYYTTDGSTPTVDSTLYTSSFDLVRSCTIKAIAVENGKQPSNVASFKYNLTGFNISSADFSDYSQLEKFWQPTISKISTYSGNVIVDASNCPYLSNAVMKALHQNSSVTLTIRRSDGSSIVIPAGKALTDYQDNVRVWYSLDYLAEKFK